MDNKNKSNIISFGGLIIYILGLTINNNGMLWFGAVLLILWALTTGGKEQ